MNWRRVLLILSITLVCIGVIIAVFEADAKAAEPSRQDLVRSVQSELKRVGCFAGSIDGNWNAASQRSLDRFNKRAGTKFDVKFASIEMLYAIRAETSRICPEANAKTAKEAAKLKAANDAAAKKKAADDEVARKAAEERQAEADAVRKKTEEEEARRKAEAEPAKEVAELAGQAEIVQKGSQQSAIAPIQVQPQQYDPARNCVRFPQQPNPEAELRYLLSHPNTRVCPSPHPDLAGQRRALEEGATDRAIANTRLRCSMSGHVCGDLAIEPHKEASLSAKPGSRPTLPSKPEITADTGGVAISGNVTSSSIDVAPPVPPMSSDVIKEMGGKLPPGDVAISAVDPVTETCRERLYRLGIIVTEESKPCVDVGKIVDNLARGTYSFNKPKAVNLGEAFPVRLVLQTVVGQAVSFAGLPGNVERREDKPFAQSVEATLSGDDFEITPAGPQGRTATFAQPVEWDWKLKPTSAGTKSLTIEVAANIFVGADKHRVQITTLHESIDIEVTILQRLKAYVADTSGLIVAAATLATPLAALIGFVPKVRKFFKDEVLRFWRRRNRRRAT